MGETPQTLRDLSVSLDNLGNVRREAGDLTAATAAYEESLTLRRRLRDSVGETPQTLRDLSVSLDRLGDLRQTAGDLTAATAAYEEALRLNRTTKDSDTLSLAVGYFPARPERSVAKSKGVESSDLHASTSPSGLRSA